MSSLSVCENPDWSTLPHDALIQVANKLPTGRDVSLFASVCLAWRSAALENTIWKPHLSRLLGNEVTWNSIDFGDVFKVFCRLVNKPSPFLDSDVVIEEKGFFDDGEQFSYVWMQKDVVFGFKNVFGFNGFPSLVLKSQDLDGKPLELLSLPGKCSDLERFAFYDNVILLPVLDFDLPDRFRHRADLLVYFLDGGYSKTIELSNEGVYRDPYIFNDHLIYGIESDGSIPFYGPNNKFRQIIMRPLNDLDKKIVLFESEGYGKDPRVWSVKDGLLILLHPNGDINSLELREGGKEKTLYKAKTDCRGNLLNYHLIEKCGDDRIVLSCWKVLEIHREKFSQALIKLDGSGVQEFDGKQKAVPIDSKGGYVLEETLLRNENSLMYPSFNYRLVETASKLCKLEFNWLTRGIVFGEYLIASADIDRPRDNISAVLRFKPDGGWLTWQKDSGLKDLKILGNGRRVALLQVSSDSTVQLLNAKNPKERRVIRQRRTYADRSEVHIQNFGRHILLSERSLDQETFTRIRLVVGKMTLGDLKRKEPASEYSL